MVRFKELHCLLESPQNGTCNAYLGDLEAGKEITVRFTCRCKHQTHNRIEFHQTEDGIITWRALPKDEKKSYSDDHMRIENTYVDDD